MDVFGTGHTGTHQSKGDLKRPPENSFYLFCKNHFNVICDCSDYKRAICFESEWDIKKNRFLNKAFVACGEIPIYGSKDSIELDHKKCN